MDCPYILITCTQNNWSTQLKSSGSEHIELMIYFLSISSSTLVSRADQHFRADSFLTRPECNQGLVSKSLASGQSISGILFPLTHKNCHLLKSAWLPILTYLPLCNAMLGELCFWRPLGSQTIRCDPGDKVPTCRETHGKGGLSWREGLWGPEVSRGVCEMTVAPLGGLSPFH